MTNYANVSLTNNSSTNIDLLLKFKGSSEEWQSFVTHVDRANKILVTETPVFIKDGLVLEYDRIEDYILDFKYRLANLKVQRLDYFKRVNDDELLFQSFKEKYLLFMLETKGKRMRTDEEIDSFIKDLTKGYDNVQRRLESILLRSLSEEELERTRNKIKELKSELIQQENDLLAARKAFEMMEDTSLKRATQNRSNSITDLFSEEEEIDGIEVFSNNNKNNDEPETETESDSDE